MLLAATNNFTFNLEAIGILLGILVSATILLGLLIQFANKISKLETKLQYLHQELLEHGNLEGHKVIVEKLNSNSNQLHTLEKQLDVHIQDYINRKDLIQYMFGQLDQKVDHKFNRTYTSMKDIEKFLQKSNNFRIREYSDEGEQ